MPAVMLLAEGDEIMKTSRAVFLSLMLAAHGSVSAQQHSQSRPTTISPRSAATRSARVRALADAHSAAYFDQHPESMTYYGIPGARHDRLRDNSLVGVERWQAQEDASLAALRKIDHTRLAGRPEWVTYGTLRETLEASVAGRVCRTELWDVNQTAYGWPSWLADLGRVQPIGTEELRAQALARWRALPRFVDNEIGKLREGIRRGYTAPKGNVRLVIGQVDALLSTSATESPFYGPASRDSTPSFQTELEAIVTISINPALKRYRDFLEREYLPRARDVIGVSANPNGGEVL